MKTFIVVIDMCGYNTNDITEQLDSLNGKGGYSVRFCVRCGESATRAGLYYWKVAVELSAKNEAAMTNRLIAIDAIYPSSIEWYSEFKC
ncbi:MAG: hypothetical protein AAB733_03195 [Patescibacteria group bacterium]